MNIIDIIVLLLLVIALWSGWRKGIIIQVCSLVGLIVSLVVAFKFGTEVGTFCRIDSKFVAIGGFAITFVGTFIVAQILSRLLRKLFHAAGLGATDRILGIVLSELKYILVLGILFSTFYHYNQEYEFMEERTLKESKSFVPLMHLSEQIVPLVEWVKEQIPTTNLPSQPKQIAKGEAQKNAPDTSDSTSLEKEV